MKQILLIGFGGFLGSILRFMISTRWTAGWSETWPVGTFMVNVLGSFAIGMLVGFSVKTDHPIYWFLAIGFCGGFTTFSSFALDSVHLIKQNLWSAALGYNLLSMILGIVVCLLGIWIGNKLV